MGRKCVEQKKKSDITSNRIEANKIKSHYIILSSHHYCDRKENRTKSAFLHFTFYFLFSLGKSLVSIFAHKSPVTDLGSYLIDYVVYI